MAVARKPKTPAASGPDVDVDALINKGGSAAGSAEPLQKEQGPVQVNLRFPPALLQRVDKALSARPLKTPRQTWILEAVLEKLKQEPPE